MKFSDILSHYDFHETLVKNIIYSHQTSELVVDLMVSNASHPNFGIYIPDHYEGVLVIMGIKSIVIDPNPDVPLCDVVGDGKLYGTIIGDPSISFDEALNEICTVLLFNIHYHKPNPEMYYEISITADAVKWLRAPIAD